MRFCLVLIFRTCAETWPSKRNKGSWRAQSRMTRKGAPFSEAMRYAFFPDCIPRFRVWVGTASHEDQREQYVDGHENARCRNAREAKSQRAWSGEPRWRARLNGLLLRMVLWCSA